MSAFHPALTGILYGDLAQYEQLLAETAIAASLTHVDVDSETAERYTAIVDGLKRMIALAESPKASQPSLDFVEKTQHHYRVLGSLIEKLSDFEVMGWGFRTHSGIDANVHYKPDGGNDMVRTMIHAIAARIGVDFVEERHGSSGDQLIVHASGKVDGVRVRIWELISAERPICNTHHVMVDADGVCQTCRATEPSFCTIHDSGPIAPGAKCSTCADLSEAAEADDAAEGRFTDAQLDGTACSECGGDFAEGAATVPTGLVVDGGQLFAHPDCLTDTTTTEPPGDAP